MSVRERNKKHMRKRQQGKEMGDIMQSRDLQAKIEGGTFGGDGKWWQ